MKNNTPNLLTLFALLLLLLTACKQDDDVPMMEDVDSRIEIETGEFEGNLSLNIDGNDLTELRLLSGYNEASIELTQTSEENITGTFNMVLHKNTVQLLTMLDGETPLGYALINPDDASNSIVVDARSTALTMLMMHPLLIDLDPVNFLDAANFITANSQFDILVNVVDEHIQARDLEGMEDSDIYQNVLVQFILARFSNGANSSSGLEVTRVTNEDFAFDVVNRRKRWISISAKIKPEGALEFENRQVTLNDVEMNSYLLESPLGEYGFLSDLLAESQIPGKLVVKNSSNYEEAIVTCIGPGVSGEVSGDDEEAQWLNAIVYTGFFDFMVPFIGGAFGVRAGRLRGELRGRPNNELLKELLQRLTAEFNNELVKAALKQAATNNDEVIYVETILSVVKNFLTNSDNFRLIKNLMREILLDDTALIFAKNFFPVLKLTSILNSSTELALAISGVLLSDVKTEFTFTAPETGIFDVYPVSESSLVGDLEVSADGTEIWLKNGLVLFRYDPVLDEFVDTRFVDYFLTSGYAINSGIPGMAIHPITNQLYLGLVDLNNGEGTIIKRTGDNQFEEVVSQLEIGIDYRNQMTFDNLGNLWIKGVYSSGNYALTKVGADNTIQKFPDLRTSHERIIFDQDDQPLLINEYTRDSDNQRMIAIYSLSPTGEFVDSLEIEVFGDSLTIGPMNPTNGEEVFLLDRQSNFALGGILPQYPEDDLSVFLYYDRNTMELTTETNFDGITSPTFPTFSFGGGFDYMVEDNDGRIWFSDKTNKEIIFFRNNGSYIYFTPNNSNLPSIDGEGAVYDIEAGPNSAVWISYGHYILKYNG